MIFILGNTCFGVLGLDHMGYVLLQMKAKTVHNNNLSFGLCFKNLSYQCFVKKVKQVPFEISTQTADGEF